MESNKMDILNLLCFELNKYNYLSAISYNNTNYILSVFTDLSKLNFTIDDEFMLVLSGEGHVLVGSSISKHKYEYEHCNIIVGYPNFDSLCALLHYYEENNDNSSLSEILKNKYFYKLKSANSFVK